MSRYRDTEIGAALADWVRAAERLGHDLEGLAKFIDIRGGLRHLNPDDAGPVAELFLRRGTRLPTVKQRSKSGKTYSYVYEEPEELIAAADRVMGEADAAQSVGDPDLSAQLRAEESELRARARMIRLIRRVAGKTNHQKKTPAPRRSAGV